MTHAPCILLLGLFATSGVVVPEGVADAETRSRSFGLIHLLKTRPGPVSCGLAGVRREVSLMNVPFRRLNPDAHQRVADAPLDGPGGKPGDLLDIHLDRYIPGLVRAAFLKTAGKDNDLTQEEFDQSAKANNLSRPFDYWENLLVFDENKDGKLDFFEFDAYRRELRSRTIFAYDDDRNGRLEGDEVVQAETDLRRGDLSKLEDARIARLQEQAKPNSAKPTRTAPAETYLEDVFKQIAGDDTEIDQQEFDSAFVEKDQLPAPQWAHIIVFDKDRNGLISVMEFLLYSRALQEFEVRRFDENGDGVVSDFERKPALQYFQEFGISPLQPTR